MNTPKDNTAAKGLRWWWLAPPRSGMQRLINPWEYRHLRVCGLTRIAGGSVRAAGRSRVPLVPGVRMGSLLLRCCGAESGWWPLVPHYRSLRFGPNLSLGDMID